MVISPSPDVLASAPVLLSATVTVVTPSLAVSPASAVTDTAPGRGPAPLALVQVAGDYLRDPDVPRHRFLAMKRQIDGARDRDALQVRPQEERCPAA
jgi:hypothetical protein